MVPNLQIDPTQHIAVSDLKAGLLRLEFQLDLGKTVEGFQHWSALT